MSLTVLVRRLVRVAGCALAIGMPVLLSAGDGARATFDVRDYGASGRKADNARTAIQKAIDACAAAGGGTVYFPPGDYSSGTIHLRSHVRLLVDAGATIFSIKEKGEFDKEALIFADGADHITIEGGGTIDGQAEYEWRPDDIEDDFIRPNKELMLSLGKPINRSFPKPNQYGKLVLLLRCTDVRIAGLSFVNSPSWTIHPYACERMVIDGVHIRSSLAEGVWADGIDALAFRQVRNLRLRDVEVAWGEPASAAWRSALSLEDVAGLSIDGFSGRQAAGADQAAAVVLDNVADAVVRDCRAPAGTGTFLRIAGTGTRGLVLHDNDLTRARVRWAAGPEVPKGAVRER